MDTQEKQLIAWAAQMIREQDEFCRSMVPGYDSFSQQEMKQLTDLEKLARGASVEDIHQGCRRAADRLENLYYEAEEKIAQVLHVLENYR